MCTFLFVKGAFLVFKNLCLSFLFAETYVIKHSVADNKI